MTITIPIWLLWVLGIPLGLIVLFLAVVGIGAISAFTKIPW